MRTAPSAWQLERVISLAQQTVEALRTEHGQVLDDESSVLAALAEEGVDVDGLLRRMVRAALDAKANAAAADARMDDLKARRDRFRRHEEGWRAAVLGVMEALNLPKVSDPEFGLSVRTGAPKLHITDPDKLPADMVEFVTTLRPMTAEIKAALTRGDEVPGATLSNGSPILTIRSS